MSKKKVREMRFTRRLTDVWIVTDRSTGDPTGLAEDNLGLHFAPPATLALWTSPTTSPQADLLSIYPTLSYMQHKPCHLLPNISFQQSTNKGYPQ